jgi:hypothetical protein
MKNFFEKAKNLAGLTALGAMSVVSQGKLEASELNIAKAQTKIVETRFDAKIKIAKTEAEKEKLRNEKEVALAEAELREAKAQDADEKKLTKPAAPAGELGASAKDTSNKKVAFRKVETDDGKGNRTVAFEGTRDGANLVKEEINANRPGIMPGNNVGLGGVVYGPDGRVGMYPNGAMSPENQYENDNGNRLRDIPPYIRRTPPPENVDTGSRLRGN